MFKNLCLVLLSICFISLPFKKSNLLFNDIVGTYTFYTKTSVSSDFVSVDSALAKSLKSKLKNLCGESVCFKFDKGIIKKVLSVYNAKFLFNESGEDFNCDYYFSNKIPYYQLIEGVKVNIQVAYGKENAVIGSPLIYGGF